MHRAAFAAAALLLGLAAAPAAHAQAAAGPVVAPTRDVAVTYRITGGRNAGELRMAWLVAEEKMRLDTPGSTFIRDNRSKRDIVLMHEQKMFVDAAADRKAGRSFTLAEPGDKVTREGTDRVAGLECTNWRIEAKKTDPDDDAAVKRVCLTADGVPLRSVEGEGGSRTTTVATRVDYGSPDPAQFRVPEGYKPFDAKAFAPQRR